MSLLSTKVPSSFGIDLTRGQLPQVVLPVSRLRVGVEIAGVLVLSGFFIAKAQSAPNPTISFAIGLAGIALAAFEALHLRGKPSLFLTDRGFTYSGWFGGSFRYEWRFCRDFQVLHQPRGGHTIGWIVPGNGGRAGRNGAWIPNRTELDHRDLAEVMNAYCDRAHDARTTAS